MTTKKKTGALELDLGALELDLGGTGLDLAMGGITLAGADPADDAPPMTPDSVEAEALAEVSEVLAGFKGRADREEQRYEDATDSEYWVALCFQTRAQKEEFLDKVGWSRDLHGDKYLDGMLMAETLGVELESRVPPLPEARVDSRLARLAR